MIGGESFTEGARNHNTISGQCHPSLPKNIIDSSQLSEQSQSGDYSAPLDTSLGEQGGTQYNQGLGPGEGEEEGRWRRVGGMEYEWDGWMDGWIKGYL